MGLIKGNKRLESCWTPLLSSLIFLFGLINVGVPGSRANVCPERFEGKDYPLDIFNIGYSDLRIFSVKRDVPVLPYTKKVPQPNSSSRPLSEQCYFKEGRRVFSDRGPETALLIISVTYTGYPLCRGSILFHNPFVSFSTGNGNISKIRPPPQL